MDAFLLNTLCGYPVTAMCFYAITCMVPFRHRWVFALGVSGALTLLRMALYWLGLVNINDIIQIPLAIIICVLMSKGKIGYRIFAASFTMFIMTVGEVLQGFVVTSLGLGITADSSSIIITNIGKFYIARTVDLLIVAMLSYLSVLLWNRFVKNASQKSMLPFVTFPITQLLLVWYLCVVAAKTGGEMKDYIWIGSLTLLSTVADAVMLVFMNRQKYLEDAQTRADLLEMQLAGQEAYYKQIMQDAEETARVRHDMRNELQTAYALLESGEKDAAERIFGALKDNVSSPRVFCKNRVANVVMSNKAEICRASGIQLRHNIALDECAGISESDMCSLFANVMDNAIKGCRESGAEKPYIELTASEKKGYLILECVNSAPPVQNSPKAKCGLKDEHGWGLSILENMAGRCEGRMETESTPGKYRIAMYLKTADK
jgi:hypothetical protein